MRNRLLLWAAVLVGVFLLGFLPPYIRASRLESESRETAARLRGLEVRDLAALAATQAAQKNFGLAAQTVSQFFNRVREVAGETKNENERSALEDLMKTRDPVTAALAKGDPSAVELLQSNYLKARVATQY